MPPFPTPSVMRPEESAPWTSEHTGGAVTRMADFVLDEALTRPAFRNLEPRDRGFAMALAMATLRRLGPIDRALQGRLAKPPPDGVVNILRIGLAQAFVLETPAFAAVTTSVDLAASHSSTRAFKGLVNGVLRALLREPPDLNAPDAL